MEKKCNYLEVVLVGGVGLGADEGQAGQLREKLRAKDETSKMDARVDW